MGLNVSRAVAQEWADTETTTALWRAISSGDKEALETLLEADEKNAHVRAADGRGPLWCALPSDDCNTAPPSHQ